MTSISGGYRYDKITTLRKRRYKRNSARGNKFRCKYKLKCTCGSKCNCKSARRGRKSARRGRKSARRNK